ncbi:MAG: mechanosensitive ion channel family protein [Deltaproteobacteria bacterium]|nr:mechanosensitive ion channel family protein [Deltaproteobacteria bacterium]
MLGHLFLLSKGPILPAWDEIPGIIAVWWSGLGETWLPRLTGALVALLAALVVWALGRIVLAFLAKQARKTKNELDDLIIEGLQSILAWVAFSAGAWFAVKSLEIPSLTTIVQAAVIVIMAVPLTRVATRVVSFLEARIASKTETKADDIIFEITGRFSGIVIYGLALILALDHLGINITPFIAGAGVMGVAIGFAAKDTLSNLVAGILLLIDRPFEKGDRIELWSAPPNSATWGDVVDIGLRATRVRTTDNIIIVIPNNEIMMRDIINYTGQGKNIRLRIRVGIAYTADVELAKKLLIDIARELDWVVDEPKPPLVVVKSFGESSVELELRVWIKDARKRIYTISHVTDRAHDKFKKAGIEIPYPKRDIYVHQASPTATTLGGNKRSAT